MCRHSSTREIAPGSSEIQTMIDILWKLPASRNVNPIIADIFIYSRTSGYLMNSSNLFFDIERMYPIFRIEGMSALQFRSFYLTQKTSGFLPQSLPSSTTEARESSPTYRYRRFLIRAQTEERSCFC